MCVYVCVCLVLCITDVDGLEAGSYYCVKTSSEDLHFAEIFSPEDPDETRDFTFDHVFGPAASQAEVYHKIRSTVLPVLCGYNATVMGLQCNMNFGTCF